MNCNPSTKFAKIVSHETFPVYIQYVDLVILLVYTAPPCSFRMVSHCCHHLTPWQLALLNFPQHSLFHLINSSLIRSSFPSHQEVTHDASQLSAWDTYIYLSIPLSTYYTNTTIFVKTSEHDGSPESQLNVKSNHISSNRKYFSAKNEVFIPYICVRHLSQT